MHICCHLCWLLTAQIYPAKSSCPDCPSHIKNIWVSPSLYLTLCLEWGKRRAKEKESWKIEFAPWHGSINMTFLLSFQKGWLSFCVINVNNQAQIIRLLHCKYLRPNYNQIAAYGRTTTAIPWFQPLVVGCQSMFIVDIARTYLQPHYGNGVFGNVYLSAGQH